MNDALLERLVEAFERIALVQERQAEYLEGVVAYNHERWAWEKSCRELDLSRIAEGRVEDIQNYTRWREAEQNNHEASRMVMIGHLAAAKDNVEINRALLTLLASIHDVESTD